MLAEKLGADYVKMPAGFGPDGATIEGIGVMHPVIRAKPRRPAASATRTGEASARRVEPGANRPGNGTGSTIVDRIRSRVPAAQEAGARS